MSTLSVQVYSNQVKLDFMKRGVPPDLYSYLSYRDYLRDWYAAQKVADRRFSYRLFARRAGVKSPSLLSEVTAGRRSLTANTARGFITALRLEREEASFFLALVQFEQASDAAEKNDAWERIAASRRFRTARPVDEGLVRYLSNWYYPATRELALRPDFRDDPDWIARQLRPAVTRAQARDALETLLALGMLVRDGGRVVPAEVSVATPHEIAGLAAHNYHQGMLQRAAEALTSTPAEERHYCAVTVAIPRSLIPQLKGELDALQERLLHLCDQQADSAEQVYQINLQLLPLSRAREETP